MNKPEEIEEIEEEILDDMWREREEEYADYVLESWESGYFGF